MDTEGSAGGERPRCCAMVCSEQLQQEFRHLKSEWWWLLLFGILLAACGSAAIVIPTLTALLSVTAVVVLGVTLMVAGIATVVTSFWTGKWSGMLVQLLVGILYIMVGFVITESPAKSTIGLTLIVAAFFIVAGVFRAVAALVIRFPHWGWALLNGLLTFLVGVIIYRHFPQSAIWVLGLLIGLEMLFHGWTWIMLSLAVRQIPDKPA